MGMGENLNKQVRELSQDELRRNRAQFIEWFDTRSRQTIQIQNHHYTLPYGTDSQQIDDRSVALDEYLIDPQSVTDHNWGRTIMSELAFEDMLRREMGEILAAQGLHIVPATTSLDGSRRDHPPENDQHRLLLPDEALESFANGHPPYNQKGADLVLLDDKQHAIVGFDATIGGRSTLQEKRKRVPLQPYPAMPVITLGLQKLPIAGHWGFIPFLDRTARNSVLLHGQLKIEQYRWDEDTVRYLRHTLTTGIQAARRGLKQDLELGFPYPYLDEVRHKLNVTEELFQNALG
ncbi:hypothetical protein IPM65_02155 [Candidatus Roizmanbacteria bacterium]|nr:MAG: hypothetical protein IPM65_02155 [Candidatus Roizmanbacteria bacterium]